MGAVAYRPAMLPEGLKGFCDPRFSPVADLFADHLARGLHHGAAVAVFHRGEPVVDLWGGRRGLPGDESPWTEDTMAICFSTTKGVSATALHMVLERHGIGYDTPVADIWPEFAANGKERITIRHVLCHEAGVPQIRGEVDDVSDQADWDAMVAMVERLTPLWEPGTQNGYHAVNFGWIVGEILRRIDGRMISAFLAEEIAGPLGLDGAYIGTPAEQHHRVAPLTGQMEFDVPPGMEAYLGEESMLRRALSPEGDGAAFLNSPAGLSTCGPAFTGVFTARSLATIYAALERGGELNGVRLLSPETLATATTVQNKRPDLVLYVPSHWRLGYMGGASAWSPAGPNRAAFGHSGLGGSVGLADPTAEISFALVLDKLQLNLLGDSRGRPLLDAAIACATG